jgi:hypothetical protein
MKTTPTPIATISAAFAAHRPITVVTHDGQTFTGTVTQLQLESGSGDTFNVTMINRSIVKTLFTRRI